jgi:hypothetical protein
MNKEAKPEKSNRLSEGMQVALISAIASIVAALIGGVFVLYSTFATSHSQSAPIFITSQPQSTSVPTFATTHAPSTPILSSNVTSTPILSGKVTSTPTSPSNTSALSVYPTSVAFSSCSSKDNRTFAFNITNNSNAPISWTISSGSAYSYSLLAQNSGQITQGSPTTGGNIPAQQTQAVLVSNILGNGVISVSENGQAVIHGINIVCTTSSSSSVYPQLVTFNSCSSPNAGNFVLSIINNSSTKISWQITNQVPTTSGIFSTFDGKGSYGTIGPKQTEVVLVGNITANTIFIVQDVTHNTPLPISITCS